MNIVAESSQIQQSRLPLISELTPALTIQEQAVSDLVSGIQSLRPSEFTRAKLNPKAVEHWINEVLSQADYLDIPGSIAVHDNQTPLARYGVDRNALIQNGLGSDGCDRIFQGLFVYSIGFNTMVSDLVRVATSKYAITSRLWKVYAVLLEYCTVLDYKHIVTQVDTEAKARIADIQRQREQDLAAAAVKIQKVQAAGEQALKQASQLEIEHANELRRIAELEKVMITLQGQDQENLALRLKFETKVNQMHAKELDMTTTIAHLKQLVEECSGQLRSKSIRVQELLEHAEALVLTKLDLVATISMGEMSKNSAIQRAKDAEHELGELWDALQRAKANGRDLLDSNNVLSTQKRELDIDGRKKEARISTLSSQVNELETELLTAKTNCKAAIAHDQEVLDCERIHIDKIKKLDGELKQVIESNKFHKVRYDKYYQKSWAQKEQLQALQTQYDETVYKREYYDELIQKATVKKKQAELNSEKQRSINLQLEDTLQSLQFRLETTRTQLTEEHEKLIASYAEGRKLQEVHENYTHKHESYKASAKRKYDQLKSEKELARKELRYLRNQIEGKTQIQSDQATENQEQESHITEVHKSNIQLKELISAEQMKNGHFEYKLKVLGQSVTTEQKKYEQLSENFLELKQATVKLEVQKATLEEELLLERKKRFSALDQLKIVLTDKVRKWKQRCAELVMQVEDIRSTAAKRTDQFSKARKQAIHYKTEYKTTHRTLSTELVQLKEQHGRSLADGKKLQKKLDMARYDLQNLQTEHDRMSKKFISLSSYLEHQTKEPAKAHTTGIPAVVAIPVSPPRDLLRSAAQVVPEVNPIFVDEALSPIRFPSSPTLPAANTPELHQEFVDEALSPIRFPTLIDQEFSTPIPVATEHSLRSDSPMRCKVDEAISPTRVPTLTNQVFPTPIRVATEHSSRLASPMRGTVDVEIQTVLTLESLNALERMLQQHGPGESSTESILDSSSRLVFHRRLGQIQQQQQRHLNASCEPQQLLGRQRLRRKMLTQLPVSSITPGPAHIAQDFYFNPYTNSSSSIAESGNASTRFSHQHLSGSLDIELFSQSRNMSIDSTNMPIPFDQVGVNWPTSGVGGSSRVPLETIFSQHQTVRDDRMRFNLRPRLKKLDDSQQHARKLQRGIKASLQSVNSRYKNDFNFT